jgi:hypothetical protein
MAGAGSGRSKVCATMVFAASMTMGLQSEARPQWTAGATTGAALTDLGAQNGPRLAYHLGGRLELLLFRETPRDMAIGPYIDVATAAFDTFESGGGASWLVPTGSAGFLFSAGAFARTSRAGLEPGVEGTIFWGARSYNFHSSYAIGAGLFVQGRHGLGESRQNDGILGVQIDLEYLALPFVFAYEAVSH